MNDDRPTWTQHAACAGKPQHWWYPEHGQGATKAKRICAGCPVQQQCLDQALAEGEQHGVWGGYTLRERRTISAGRAPRRTGDNRLPPTREARCGSDAGYQGHRRRGEHPCGDCLAAHANAGDGYRRTA